MEHNKEQKVIENNANEAHTKLHSYVKWLLGG